MAYVNKLQLARASKVVNNPRCPVELTREDIVAVAIDDQYGVKLVVEEQINKPVQTVPAQPPRHQTVLASSW